MFEPFFVGGEAGAGKTRKLMETAPLVWEQHMSGTHQTLLAIALMHGARRQLDLSLARFCPTLPATVSTIHSFALRIANRWRRTVGLSSPISICETSCGLAAKNGRTYATFEELLSLACDLLESPTVGSTIADSHPVAIVDEFQDCSGNTLKLVQTLGKSVKLLLAADDFQLLFNGTRGCPSVDWVEQLNKEKRIHYEYLAGCNRTDVSAILHTARCLRHNVRATQSTVTVYHGFQPGQLACRIVERFTGWGKIKAANGTCALIVLSSIDVQVTKLLDSFKKQLESKTRRRIIWSQSQSDEQQLSDMLTELGINPSAPPGSMWSGPGTPLSGAAANVVADVRRFAKLRGMPQIPEELVTEFGRLAVHNARAFAKSLPRCQLLTVFGAKNREFDHVFIFWDFKRLRWPVDEQRRLLYNAVTRAKVDCTILFMGSAEDARADQVLSLLGTPQPAIDPTWSRRVKSKGQGASKRLTTRIKKS